MWKKTWRQVLVVSSVGSFLRAFALLYSTRLLYSFALLVAGIAGDAEVIQV